MEQCTSRNNNLSIGDLVNHVLYGKEWVGMILGFEYEEGPYHARNEKALIQIQPGTKYEGFFKTKVAPNNKINDNLGFVTSNWLFKIEVKNENS
tara:strand:+ start:1505 stop:1786 length:282 start_codon:yes stop_codon:yes gene_type:complete